MATSLFTSSYVFNWSKYMQDTALQYCPTFDGRIVQYPDAKVVRDYFAWRQADSTRRTKRDLVKRTDITYSTAHINNLYNTLFWALVLQGGQSTADAHKTLMVRLSNTLQRTFADTSLQGTVSTQKHEMLFSRFGINYNDLPPRFRKGSVLVREEVCTFLPRRWQSR